jgi:hypothetical protein
MWNARPLEKFNQSGWIQVDFAPLIKRWRMDRPIWQLKDDLRWRERKLQPWQA